MKILLVEDNSEDAEFLRLSLAQRNATTVNITRASLVSEAVTALDDEHFDVVLLDLNLPDARGAECVESIQEADDLVPIVVLSGHGDEDFALEILNRGDIDDNKEVAQVKRRHLELDIKEHLAGKKVGTPKTEVFA